MNLHLLTLDRFSHRTLNLLASIFGRCDVRVVLSQRATHPATVVLESRTVVLNPKATGLYDLALCARLLKHRALRKEGPKDAVRRDRWLTRRAHRKLVPRAHKELVREYPCICQLQGRYQPGAGLEGFCMVARSVEWSPLDPLPPKRSELADGQPGLHRSRPERDHPGTGFGFEQIPELEITGAGDDFAWLLATLENGGLPLQTVPGLDELPYLRVPFRLTLAEGPGPTLEVFEEMLASSDSKELIEGFMDCYTRKSEVRQEKRVSGRHTHSGAALDSNRLVDAAVAQRIGKEPRLFRQPDSLIEPVFDPRQHLVVLTFDINDLRRSDNPWMGNSRESVRRFVGCMLTAYQRLQVDCVVLGFADQLVALSDGRHVCLHMAVTLKRIEEEFDESFWNRLVHLLDHPPLFPGRPTCFHPLSLQDVTETFDAAAQEGDHSYRAILWWARRGMPHDFAAFRTEDFLIRTADHIDGEVDNLEKRFTGTLDTLACLLPAPLKQHGRPGRFLQNIEIS